ncbi:uncharacterized protein BYT42DRAFT_610088 [Radiomyces spectabilis]|uniref:uncharacterized protein n=1 Tax=Radiomyces spectabilis TaxID=64574 RepID=UPI00221E6574|nr:uncharacterized protein BYT42DRAFT_610088 [Radiomyces spectabilis]KAI8390810.1 hypothetical protein BYT42DRAFT_610088 [Radiomyces spectabilis]
MYFSLPSCQERRHTKPLSIENHLDKQTPLTIQLPSEDLGTNGSISETRLIEIFNNIQDHWGSPPILTPDTLAYILSNQWVKDTPLQGLNLPMKMQNDEEKERCPVSQLGTHLTTAVENEPPVNRLVDELSTTARNYGLLALDRILATDPLLQNKQTSANDVIDRLTLILHMFNNQTVSMNMRSSKPVDVSAPETVPPITDEQQH